MPEKRRFTRFKTTLYIRYNHLNSGEQFSAIAQNISMGGVKIALNKSLKLSADDFLTLYLLIPQATIKVTGKVVWSAEAEREKEAGISFVNFADSHKEDIYNYIFKYYRQEITDRWWENQ
jgi:c-di-GMP-binding flagellar brake protein YcgR